MSFWSKLTGAEQSNIEICQEQDPTRSWYDCHWENFVEFYFPGQDPKEISRKAWLVGGLVTTDTAYMLLTGNYSVTQKFRSVKDVAEQMPYGIKNEIKAITGVKLEVPSYYLNMGFSNVKEFYALMGLLLAWAYALTRESGYKTLARKMLDRVDNRPSDVAAELYKTPSSTNEAVMKEFAKKVTDAVYPVWLYEVSPYLQKSTVKNILERGEYEMRNAGDTIQMAVLHNGIYKDDQFDWQKTLLSAIGLYVVFKVVTR